MKVNCRAYMHAHVCIIIMLSTSGSGLGHQTGLVDLITRRGWQLMLPIGSWHEYNGVVEGSWDWGWEGGRGTDDGGTCFPRKCSEIASEVILVLSPTGVHGKSNTAVHHDTCQSSQGVSVTIVDLVVSDH